MHTDIQTFIHTYIVYIHLGIDLATNCTTSGHMVKGERVNLLPSRHEVPPFDHQQGFFYMHHPTDRIVHTTAFVTPAGRNEMFYLTTHSTHFIYGYMASDIWLRTILIVRKETRCRHIGYSLRLTAMVLICTIPQTG